MADSSRPGLRAFIRRLVPGRTAAATRGFSAPVTPAAPGPAPVGGDEIASTYAPDIDGDPDPGEVVWAWVAYEDDPSQGKDRPVLILAEEPGGWVGLMLSSQDHDRDAAQEASWGRHWMDVGSGGWDAQGRPSEVRLDRRIHLVRADVRREGAALDEAVFDSVVAAVRGLPR